MTKRLVIFIVFLYIITSIATITLVSSNIPVQECYKLPDIVYKFKDLYVNVQINDTRCYPSYRFMTPTSYSKFGLSYSSGYFPYNYQYDSDIQIYDNKIKRIISSVENCPGFQEYYKLMVEGLNDHLITQINDFVEIDYLGNITGCKNRSRILEGMKPLKQIDVFLKLNKLGDYSSCILNQGMISSNNEYTEVTVNYIICDGENERLSLHLQNREIKEAYFLDHKNEPYREVYPEDIKLKRRSTVWESPIKNFIIDYLLAIIIILLIVIFFFFRKIINAPQKSLVFS